MNWTEPRKSYKSSQHIFSVTKKIQTTCLNTPHLQKQYRSKKQQFVSSFISNSRQCPYHFNKLEHVCLSCRKSVCLRCVITYCQNHIVKQEKQIIPILKHDFQKMFLDAKVQQIQVKLSQSNQRQQYFENKILKLIQKIEQDFQTLVCIIKKKKLQIIQYYDGQFQKYLTQYKQYDQLLKEKLKELELMKNQVNFSLKENQLTVQKIDYMTDKIKKIDFKDHAKFQKKINKMFIGKEKIKIDKTWTEEKLQKVLFQVENINYKMNKSQKRKRVVTQSAQNNKTTLSITNTNLQTKTLLKNTSNSKFSSGRKKIIDHLQKEIL